MKDKVLCVRVNKQTYDDTKEILEPLGISISVGVNMFLKKVCLKKSLPFELTYDDYNNQTKDVIKKCYQVAEDEIEYNSVDEMIEDSKNWK